MEDGKIILRKDKQDKQEYFEIIACVIIILVLTIHIVVNKRISNADKAFIDGAKAKHQALIDKAKRTKMEELLQEQRIAKLQEEKDYQATLEDKMKRQDGQILTDSQQIMDYQKKLAIYNKSRKGARRK